MKLQAGAAGSLNRRRVAFFERGRAGSLGAIFGCPSQNGRSIGELSLHEHTGLCGSTSNFAGDWTYMMQLLDGESGSRYFFQGQYDALNVYSTVGSSDYHGGTLSIRQRKASVTWDFNYTFSKSLDEASGFSRAETLDWPSSRTRSI